MKPRLVCDIANETGYTQKPLIFDCFGRTVAGALISAGQKKWQWKKFDVEKRAWRKNF